MRYSIAILLFIICNIGRAQKNVLTTDSSLIIPKLNFDANGNILIKASSASSHSDFDFLVGKWKMYHRRLNKRLENCKEWTEFESTDSNYKILSGTADMDIYSTTQMPGLEGKLFEGVTLRLFDPKSRLWSLYWVASNVGVLDPPVVGSFENNVGHFFYKRYVQWKKYNCSISLGRTRQRSSYMEPGLLSRQWQNLGVELV